jgi:hypothetical protein
MKGKILAVLVAVAAIALLSAGVAQATITATKHNLSYTGPGTFKASNGQQNNEICVWCHSPHLTNTAFVGAPIWNKATPSASYVTYGTTVDGTTADAAPNPDSKVCLSCHDGVSAVNSLVLQANAAGYNAAGYNVAFGLTTAGTGTVLPAGGINTLGTNLQNDHPVSILYTAGKANLVATTTAFGTTGTIANLLRSGKVECGSCHDPHVASGDTTAQGSIAGPMFTRLANGGSALCLACHAK